MNSKHFVGSRLVTALSFVLLLTWSHSTMAGTEAKAEGETVTAEISRLVEAITTEEDTAVALAKVQALDRLSSWVPRDVYAEPVLGAATLVEDPLVRFALLRNAEWSLHEMRDDRHGADGMNGPLAQQACLVDWRVVGPFENASMEGFERQFGPELGEVGPYRGKSTEVSWRDHPDNDRYCFFDLNRTIHPSTAAATYMATQVSVDSAKDAVLLLGAQGAYRVWLNGELVGERRDDAGFNSDNDAWRVRLKKGKNHVLIKLASTGDGGLGLMARLVDRRDLEPLKLEGEKTWSRTRVASDGETKADPRGVLQSLQETAKNGEGDDAVWAAWFWKIAESENAATPWRDVAERLSENPESLTPRRHALLSELFEEHWRRRDILEAAHQRAPNDPWISASLAREYEDGLTERDRLRVKKLYEAITEDHPEFILGPASLADWYQQNGFEARALETLRSVELPRRLEVPSFLVRLNSLESSIGLRTKTMELEEKGWGMMTLSGSFHWSLIRRASAKGDYAEALKVIRAYRRYVPESTYAALREAELFRVAGKLDEAIAIVDRLISDAPGNPDFYVRRAELLVAADRKEAAIASLQEALARRPQDQNIREKLSFLRPEQDRFHEPWMVDDVRSLAEKYEAGSFNYDTVLDQSITRVATNGLAQTVVQRVDRVITPDGIDPAESTRVSFTMGDERVDVLRVRVYKADGSISEDYDDWRSGGSRKGSTTYNDTSYLTMKANNVEVGDLIEFRYRVSQIANQNFRGDYYGDIGYLQGSRPIGFERYAVLYPNDWELYFRPPEIEHERIDGELPGGDDPPEGYRVTYFDMENVPHVETDPSQPGYTDVYDYLLVSNKETYDEVGTWWWNLVKEQLIVDEEIRKKVAELTKDLEADEQKVEAIHNYVVKNTRYLHVGLGIHGWKPYRTTTCYRNRFGDCKDKASLLKVMLEEAGIPANLVLVRTRRLGKVEDYPASMHVFNHAITYVPGMDLYLDGTAEFNGTTELTTMDQGAQALIVEDGGAAKWVTLPVDDPDDNLYREEIEVDLTGEEPVARGEIVARGANAVYFRSSLQDPERRDEVFEKRLAKKFPGAELVTAEYEHLTELEKPTRISYTFKGGELLRRDGTRPFIFPMGAPKDLAGAYAKRSKRNQDLSIRVPFANETTMRYRLPKTKKFERVPRDVQQESKWGAVTIDYQKTADGELVVDVRYSLDVQRVPVEEYPAFRAFMTEATASLNETIGINEEK